MTNDPIGAAPHGFPWPPYDGAVTTQELPPLAPPDASADERGRAIEARIIARRGAAPRLADYRRSYAACGLDWPGDDEVRRRHPVGDDPAA